MCQGFRKTLASNAEIAQLRQLIAQNAEQQAADAADGIFRDDPNAFHVMKGKRILGSAVFSNKPKHHPFSCAFLLRLRRWINYLQHFTNAKTLLEPANFFDQTGDIT